MEKIGGIGRQSVMYVIIIAITTIIIGIIIMIIIVTVIEIVIIIAVIIKITNVPARHSFHPVTYPTVWVALE